MLTLQQLKDMEPGVFADGITTIKHPWYGQSPEYPETIEVRWVATRGGIYDWAIYHSFHTNITMFASHPHTEASDRMIAENGEKLHDIEKVKELVPCDEEALEMYRH